MPSFPRRPVAQRERGRFTQGGTEALRSRGPSGPAPRLSDAQLDRVEGALLEGAAANGFTGELWTLERIALVIERLTRVQLNWKKASMAAALCYGVRGGGAQLAFHVTAGNYNTDTLIQVLGELRRFLGGEKATLLWDGLPAHRSRAMRAWLVTQRHWLVTERLPAYAPELNPVEGLWSSLKAVELANPTSPTLAEVIDQAHRGIDRVRRTPYLPYSFLQHTGLSVS